MPWLAQREPAAVEDDRALLIRALHEQLAAEAFFRVDFLLPSPVTDAPSSRGVTSSAPELPTPSIAAEAGAASAPAYLPPSAEADLPAIATAVAACQRCGLCQGRKQSVPGEGASAPELVFVGEGPGAEEDASGRPFVGPAGRLLDKMIVAMGFQRDDVFIANVIKCRPPGNRTPSAEEIAACLPWLEGQLQRLQPRVICTLGNTPLRALSGDAKAGITSRRGKPFTWRGIPVIPTFHPSYLLHLEGRPGHDQARRAVWDDLKIVLATLGREAPKR